MSVPELELVKPECGNTLGLPVPQRCLFPIAKQFANRHPVHGGDSMSQFYALLSVVFMIGFVLVFDRMHYHGYIARFYRKMLLTAGEIDQLRRIVTACE